MTVSRAYSRYGVEVHVDTESATVLGGITQQRTATASEVRADPESGELYARHVALYAQRPLASFTTFQIARGLALIGLTGKKILATLNPGLNLYAQNWEEGAGPASGASHTKHNIKEGLIVPRTISCTHQGDAELSYDVLITYDGTNEPVVKTESQALPAGITDDERFTLGPFTLASVVTGQITNLEIDFGITAETLGADSDIWDTFARLRRVQPVVRVTGTDLTWFGSSNIELAGQAATHANTTFYLRKRLNADTFVPNVTAEHVRFTADGMAVIDTIQDDSGDDPSEVSFELTTRFDGTNVPITIATASAIT